MANPIQMQDTINQLATNNQALTMSSREIATLCDKEHSNVLRDIRNMLSDLGHSFLNDEYYQILTDERNYTTEILLNKNLSLNLVTGYNAKLRLAIIKRWQELEQSNQIALPTTYLEALEALVISEKAKQALEHQAKLDAPKVAHYDLVADRTNLVNATQVASKVKMSAVVLNRYLDDLGVYNKSVKRNKRTFNHWFIESGLGQMVQTDTGFDQALFTHKGEAWVVERLVSEGVV